MEGDGQVCDLEPLIRHGQYEFVASKTSILG